MILITLLSTKTVTKGLNSDVSKKESNIKQQKIEELKGYKKYIIN